MSSEDENYVTVTVRARGREVAVPCREAVVVTMRPGACRGPRFMSRLDPESLPVLAEAAVSELVSFGVRAGIPEDRARIELVYAAVHGGYSEEDEREAVQYDLSIDAGEESGKEEKDE